MNYKENNQEGEEGGHEKGSDERTKDAAFLLVGVLFGIAGGVVSSYLMMFSKEVLLENPLEGSILAGIIIFILFCPICLFFHKQLNRSGVRGTICCWGALILLCYLIPSYLYQNAIEYQTDSADTVTFRQEITAPSIAIAKIK